MQIHVKATYRVPNSDGSTTTHELELRELAVTRYEDGKLIETWSLWDNLPMHMQLEH